jgi:hypothetical protein
MVVPVPCIPQVSLGDADVPTWMTRDVAGYVTGEEY